MSSHVQLLRDEHLQLQLKFAELQKRYDVLEASCAEDVGEKRGKLSFVQKLVSTVAQLYDRDLYSDITIHCDGHQLRGHRFVIASRTDYWNDLSMIDRIELKDIPYSVGCTVLKWMYTDRLDAHLGDVMLMDILSAAIEYRLMELRQRCEMLLIARLDVDNCVKIYQFAEQHSLERLRDKCAEVVSARWNEFGAEHFAELSAPLLYRIVKSRCKHILHSIIDLCREDVLFLFYIDNDSKLAEVSNEFNDEGVLPLELALSSKQFGIAASIVGHRGDVNCLDAEGRSLLMKAIARDEVDACRFLADNGAFLDFKAFASGESLLHTLARSRCSEEMLKWVTTVADRMNINNVDRQMRTPLLCAIEWDNQRVANFLLQQKAIDTNVKDENGRCALSVALLDKKDVILAESLIHNGAEVDAALSSGDTLVHSAVRTRNLLALQFLCANKANVNLRNKEGLSALHLSVLVNDFHEDVVRLILKSDADITMKTPQDGATALHLAVDKSNGAQIIRVLAEVKRLLPFSISDSNEDTPLARAVLNGHLLAAEELLKVGANINETERNGVPLLLRAIVAKNDEAAVFLLNKGADATIKMPDSKNCLQLAVECGLLNTVRCLCKSGANLNWKDSITGLPPLWSAISSGSFDVAAVLTEHGCDTNGWTCGDDRTYTQTLLHKAIDLNLSDAAIFLIENGCDVNALKRYEKSEMEDRQTPLHACITWNLTDVALALIKNGASVDMQDADGRTAAHLAVIEQNMSVLEAILSVCDASSLLLKDRYGASALVVAMQKRNNCAAEAIVKKAPHAVMQMNGNGENLLHTAVKNRDIESVLFLLALQTDVNVRTQDGSRVTALHICAQTGDEMIMRNLLLAGADVNATSAKGFTPLHVAAYNNHEALCMILLENGAFPNLVDYDGNTPLHAAVLQGSASSVNVLLGNPEVNARAVNKRQQTPLLLAATVGATPNSLDILQMFINADPEYPVDAADCNGNTLFLLAYMNGNAELCKSALRCGVCLAVTNNYGISVFSYETPTKQLLFSLLDSLESEPKWSDGDVCSECGAKFTLTMRKHHCRHCGRLVCARCSDRTMPILKYDLQKAVRVCEICSDVLTLGHGR
uniref:Ankyrin repeat and FYVE domain-containing protein 1 n=1 Tax=Parascaris univalens TaxID=6257 RepID=A0A915C437_PARUN